ncbi:MAG: RHS repeat-associated core domain-containing protein [Clostridia bacterium]|nr:RHS repeat-associated core domain-containing protein [Clostridia bacterium]
MKKTIFSLLVLFTSLFCSTLFIHASTLDSLDIYLKFDSINQAVKAEQAAPTSITDAGIERVDTYSGGVSFYAEELNLPGKNGLDVVVGRKFNSSNNNHIDGYSQYVSITDYIAGSASEYSATKYVFAYSLNEDFSGNTIYIAYDSLWDMLDAEKDSVSIKIASDYTDSAFDLVDTQEYYNWSTQDPYEIGFSPRATVYMHTDIIGEDITLYRNPALGYALLDSVLSKTNPYTIGDNKLQHVNIGGGWNYDIPAIIAFEDSSDTEGMYGMLYDSYTKNTVEFLIATEDGEYDSAKCFYTIKYPNVSSETDTKTNQKYTITAEITNGTYYYTLTRYDGVEFYCEDDRLLSVTDRFGNSITYGYADNTITITDTLNRTIILTENGITVNGTSVVSYSFYTYNNATEDPLGYYADDNTAQLLVSYKITDSTQKSVIYNMSQRGRTFYVGSSSSPSQTMSYSKMVIDNVVLPTGAQSCYEYEKTIRNTYYDDRTKTDYMCVTRYDLQSETASRENETVYEHTIPFRQPKVITSYPSREGYTISEQFDSDGNLTKRTTVSTVPDYTIVEEYDYIRKNGEFLVSTETVTKTDSEDKTLSYINEYSYNTYNNKTTKITRDDTIIYSAGYNSRSNYCLLNYEYNIYDTEKYRGIKNTVSGGVITKKNYALSSSASDSTPTVKESVTYTYDSYGNIASIDGDGMYVEYSYTYGDYSAETAPQYSIIITETCPEAINITDRNGVDIPSANVTKTSYYDKWGNLVKLVDGEGNTTTYTYDYLGRILTIKNPDNTTQKYSYNDSTNRIYITDENSKWTMLRYDALGRELGLYYLNEAGTAWAITYYKSYDSYGNMMGYSPYRDGIADCTTKYTYYSDNSVKTERLRNRINGDILMENIYSYFIADDNLNAVSVQRKKTDTETITVSEYTNQYGYKVKDTIDDSAEVVEQVYTTDAAGNILNVTDLRGNTAHTYTYDYRGRVLKDTQPYGSTTNVYDGAQLYQVKDGLNKVVKTYEYNNLGQLIKETTPIDDDTDNVTEYYYDRNGSLTKTVTTAGDGTTTKTTSTRYDNRNRPVAVDDGSGYFTRYEYNNLGNIIRMATGVPTATETLSRDTHSVTDYEYSYRDFLVKVTDPIGYTESYTHNSRGTVLTFTDKNGTLFEYTYNGAPWLLSKTASGINNTEQSLSYAYDYLGNVTQMVDENGTTIYTYDRLGNVLTETCGTLVKEYAYDANGNRTSALISDGSFEQSLTYVYDSNNRLTRVTDENGYTSYTYDANNRVLTEKTYKTGVSNARTYKTYSYYDGGLLNTKKNYRYSTASASYLIDDYSLTYYADGNIATVDNNDAVTSYVYDNVGRLSSESIDGTVQASYTYDAFGNRAIMTKSTSTTTYTYDKNNRLTAENIQSDSGSSFFYYSYDANGNMNEKYWGVGLAMYNYDLFGRMQSYSSEGTYATYTYDANGIRTSKTVDGVTTNFINDGAYVVGEISGDSVVKYTYGNGLVAINNNGTIGYYHTDEHGNVSAISDVSRNVVADYDFDAFGNETVSTDSYYNPMRYCGEYSDVETGLIYLRARYYDPAIGRFFSEDPIKDGTNWYVYCSNNPIAFVDPSGECYYNQDGEWRHDNWESLESRKEPWEVYKWIEVDIDLGVGLYVKASFKDAEGEVGIKTSYDLTDAFSDNPTQTSVAAIEVTLDEDVTLGASQTSVINPITGEAVDSTSFVGIQLGEHLVFDLTNLVSKEYAQSETDIIVPFEFSAYLGVGGGFSIEVNLSELSRQVYYYLEEY